MEGGADAASAGFGAVGAVAGVRSPITLAHAILSAEQKGRLSLGRIAPMYACGPPSTHSALSAFSAFYLTPVLLHLRLCVLALALNVSGSWLAKVPDDGV